MAELSKPERVASLKRLLDRALFLAFTPTTLRGGNTPQPPSVADTRNGEQRIAPSGLRPRARSEHPITRAHEETR